MTKTTSVSIPIVPITVALALLKVLGVPISWWAVATPILLCVAFIAFVFTWIAVVFVLAWFTQAWRSL
jgi:hypothetical protein